MSAEKMTKIKFFFLPDYEKEEKYLSEMHAKGWKFNGVNGGFFYHFVKCNPENVIYKIDFAGEKDDLQTYKAMFRDYGWEYIQDMNDFSYFRRNADGLSEDETEIFSDNASRLEMVNKIITNKLRLCLFFYLSELLCVIYPAINRFGLNSETMIIFATFALVTCLVTYNFVGLMRLKKKMNNNI